MNNTGLMFENAGAFNALILFAEVRGVPYAQQHAWRCSPCLATLHNSPIKGYCTVVPVIVALPNRHCLHL